jgi:DNA repair ATPase RecN
MIPILTGISASDFQQYLKTIEEKMKVKLEYYKKLENRINMSYILCQQYAMELSNLTAGCCQHDVILRKYENQKKKHQELRQRLKDFNLRPSNKTIEEILHLPEGSVRRIIAKADKSINQIRSLLDPQNQ